jgi:acyl carrier protein
MTKDARSAQEISDWLVGEVAKLIAVERSVVSPDGPLVDYLTDSRDALSLAAELQHWLGRDVSAYVMWDFPTIAALARHLADPEATSATR